MRCIKANRGCDGYEDFAVSPFRQYEANHPWSFTSTARKSSLPKHVPLPGTNILPEESLPPETTQAEPMEVTLGHFELALRMPQILQLQPGWLRNQQGLILKSQSIQAVRVIL
jgi:hypothetical protein